MTNREALTLDIVLEDLANENRYPACDEEYLYKLAQGDQQDDDSGLADFEPDFSTTPEFEAELAESLRVFRR